MLFNSYEFIFAFLPIAVAGYYLLGRTGETRYPIFWLVGCSFFFYAWWNPVYVLLLAGSIVFNYAISGFLIDGGGRSGARKLIVTAGIAGNLAALAYFKYANFFVDTINPLIGYGWTLEHIVLPLAISFFTFQQITYLVDTYAGLQKDRDFPRYCLFVTFFPQLIAGPIVHHSEMLPQFARPTAFDFSYDRIAVGTTIFLIGLFKKTVLADNIGVYSDGVFSAAGAGENVTFLEAWVGVLSYSFQIYFDFSGYSDMAIGLGCLFGIRLPLNFSSPYKSRNIIEFWRRWHMTLSRFLRDYLYIPLGGNRRGPLRQRLNLMITMLLGGLWHGAGWTFVIWGALHGLYLLINHSWQGYTGGRRNAERGAIGGSMAWLLTFAAVCFAWVFFRAETLGEAATVIDGLTGRNGIVLPDTYAAHLGGAATALSAIGVSFQSALAIPLFGGVAQIAELAVLLLICLALPNTQQFLRYEGAGAATTAVSAGRVGNIAWRPTLAWSLVIGSIGLIAVLHISGTNNFLYFNF